MKKRVLTLIIAGIMSLSLVGCGEKNNDNKESSKDSSSSVVESNNDSEEEVSDKDSEEEYVPYNKDEVNELNKELREKFRKFFEDNNIEVKESEKTKEDQTIEGICRIKYESPDEEQIPCYGGISYYATAYPGAAYIGYSFYYFVDEENLPKARDLLIAEPYKILTGDEISDETLDEIDEIISDTYNNGIKVRKHLIETNGAYKVVITTSSTDIEFSIKSRKKFPLQEF